MVLRYWWIVLAAMALPYAYAGKPAGKTEKVRETTLPNGLVVNEYKLANGMQLLLIPDHSAPVFTLSLIHI